MLIQNCDCPTCISFRQNLAAVAVLRPELLEWANVQLAAAVEAHKRISCSCRMVHKKRDK